MLSSSAELNIRPCRLLFVPVRVALLPDPEQHLLQAARPTGWVDDAGGGAECDYGTCRTHQSSRAGSQLEVMTNVSTSQHRQAPQSISHMGDAQRLEDLIAADHDDWSTVAANC